MAHLFNQAKEKTEKRKKMKKKIIPCIVALDQ
jgi:hypothetical protein